MNKISLYESMINRDEDNVEAWYLLGVECIQLDRLSDALFAFSRALENQDDDMKKLVLTCLSSYLTPRLEHQLDANQMIDSLEVETNSNFHDVHEEEQSTIEDEEPQSSKIRVIEGGKNNNIVSIEDRREEKITFANVGGLDDLKQTIEMKIIKPFTNPGLFTKFRKKSGGGILLYGPPGCGKTFIAQATAGECGANFYPVHISEILNPYVGVSEQNLQNVFETARANKPAVLFFDEIDTLGYSRTKSSSDVMRPLVDSMLTELQGIDTNTDKLLVIGATNMPWDVDGAFKRPGRFDKLMFVPPPDLEARKIIFELKLRGKPIEEGIILDVLAKKTEHYSGADIENVVEIATENVIMDIMETNTERLITMEDLLAAIHSTKPSTIEWMTTVKNYIKYANQGGLYNDAAQYIKNNL